MRLNSYPLCSVFFVHVFSSLDLNERLTFYNAQLPQYLCTNGKAAVPKKAPILPLAAETPWQVARTQVGKISAGRM